jgi:LysM repeat protein
VTRNLTRRAFVRRLASAACGAAICSISNATPPPETGTKHIVEKGDTVWGIARKYGVKPDDVIQLNKLVEPYTIFPGQVLLIPGSPASAAPTQFSVANSKHVVQKGETVWSIAKRYNTSPEEVIRLNDLKKPYRIYPGDVLVVRGTPAARSREQGIAYLTRLPRGVGARRWKYIIIHHSATPTGNAAIFGSHHRRLGMKYGLAYHFVIGNGTGSGDGEIEVGGRWKNQLHGGHVRSQKMNEIAIGICLVGDFNKSYPTRRQMENLVLLVRYLMTKYNVPAKRVVGHRDVQKTDCPGKHFSLTALRDRL